VLVVHLKRRCLVPFEYTIAGYADGYQPERETGVAPEAKRLLMVIENPESGIGDGFEGGPEHSLDGGGRQIRATVSHPNRVDVVPIGTPGRWMSPVRVQKQERCFHSQTHVDAAAPALLMEQVP
jgi:hypothetical protein